MAVSTSSTATRTPTPPGARVGTNTWAKALTYFNGSAG
jgi:hypothetical protein